MYTCLRLIGLPAVSRDVACTDWRMKRVGVQEADTWRQLAGREYSHDTCKKLGDHTDACLEDSLMDADARRGDADDTLDQWHVVTCRAGGVKRKSKEETSIFWESVQHARRGIEEKVKKINPRSPAQWQCCSGQGTVPEEQVTALGHQGVKKYICSGRAVTMQWAKGHDARAVSDNARHAENGK
ncbi:hypothetical protein Scep_028098 [Stephania cephalantha]|uniref:Uncharacterized protein n=1 Tax=Stephania cephalantha TaxID=152367 RepID=A0AAP0E9A0_9MAGN